jgi:hypothetical protein
VAEDVEAAAEEAEGTTDVGDLMKSGKHDVVMN